MLLKSRFKIIAAAVAACALILLLLGVYNKEEILLRRLIRSAGAEITSVNVTGWVRVSGEVQDAGNPSGLATEAMRRLNLNHREENVREWKNPYAGGAKVTGELPGGGMVSVTAQVMPPREGSPVVYLMVSVSRNRPYGARAYKDIVRGVLDCYGKDSRVGLTLQGRVAGEPDAEELLARAGKMMAGAAAPVTERTVKDNMVSLAGRTAQLSGNMPYSGREINLNVACRHSPADNCTYVYAGSPVILTEY